LPRYPFIQVEIQTVDSWADIVKQRFDMGCRLGGDIATERIAVKISSLFLILMR
jgi:DNA-binding transcriptional LysR family regulator